MKLSTRGRYGVRALLELALHYGEGPVLIKDIAASQEISQHYLEQIVIALKASGLVKSIRGAKGGIALAKLPSQIRLDEALQVLEGSTAPVECVDNARACSRSSFCVTRDVWNELKKAMNGVLESMTLQDLVERQRRKEKVEAVMYNI